MSLRFGRNKKELNVADSKGKLEMNNKDITSENIKTILSDSSDISYQVHYINGCRDIPVTVVFVEGLVDIKMLNDDVLKPLTQERVLIEVTDFDDIIELIEYGTVYHASRRLHQNLGDTLKDILNGAVALVFDKEKKAVTLDIKGFEKRGISEPTAENVIKGAKDAFIEVLRVNTALVRRKIRTPYLRVKEVAVGRQTNTPIAVIYIENLTNEKIVKEVFKRLEEIDIDGVLTAGSIEEFIIDHKRTMFPQVMNTERSDKFCHNIIEGRVGVIIDGLPVTYIMPATLTSFYQAPEDYAQNYVISSFLRFLRYAGSLVTLFLPAFYVAITTFHQEMIPTVLAVSIIQSKSEVPFPTVTSIFMMLIAFEILLEAGLRLPKTIGQAVSIIGALVVGQAAVQAKLISPVVVIVVAVTGICGFIMPNQDYSNALRIFRLVFVIGASIAGLYGLSLIFIMLVYHLNTIETFGVPYFSPFVANEGRELTEDTLIRLPLFLMKKRPSSIKSTNKKRQK
ncbi:spore germination protein [Petroclostridium sp. X23]|uniref:spore germination protein n=1 Tax=Petroclostridium sp. X23 TaxID=3045146 RepID=UPI0024AE24EB|nr:spore germination protein [Petroclostridium sp. X23]WHH57956.1 spore germination protein [Petroclostridium sp. X23]